MCLPMLQTQHNIKWRLYIHRELATLVVLGGLDTNIATALQLSRSGSVTGEIQQLLQVT